MTSAPRVSPSFFKHRRYLNLFQLIWNDLAMHRLLPKPRSRFSMLYEVVPYCCPYSFNQDDFIPVDVHFSDKGIVIIGDWYKFSATHPSNNIQQQPMKTAFDSIHPSLQQTCGTVHLPPDNGESLLRELRKNNNIIYSASDASLKGGKSTHAWIISSENIEDISNPYNTIYGSGPVHGPIKDLSSFRGELQSITAISIIASFLSEFASQ
jgi:hypothetical protein